jgi:hypothetical protein
MTEQSKAYRLRAVACEQRAATTPTPAIKQEWEELAIQWHLLANQAAPTSDGALEIDVA